MTTLSETSSKISSNLGTTTTNQYELISLLKERLPQDHVIVQIDFAENYVCNYKDEVAAAYFSKVQVTIHPAVFHYRNEDGTLQQWWRNAKLSGGAAQIVGGLHE